MPKIPRLEKTRNSLKEYQEPFHNHTFEHRLRNPRSAGFGSDTQRHLGRCGEGHAAIMEIDLVEGMQKGNHVHGGGKLRCTRFILTVFTMHLPPADFVSLSRSD